MDYIKISLIGLIAAIFYYLALQWSSLPQEEVQFETIENENLTLNDKVIENENLTLNNKVLDDSKDLLSALDTTPPRVVESRESNTSGLATSRLFSLYLSLIHI